MRYAAQNHAVSDSLERCIAVPTVTEVWRPHLRHSYVRPALQQRGASCEVCYLGSYHFGYFRHHIYDTPYQGTVAALERYLLAAQASSRRGAEQGFVQ